MGMDRLTRLFRLHAAFWLAIIVLAAVAALAPVDGGWPMRLAADGMREWAPFCC